MAKAVEVRVKDNGTFLYLKNLPIRANKIGNREAWNLTQFGAKKIKESAFQAGIKRWKGTWLTAQGIAPRKIRKGAYGIFIHDKGIKLDRMPPHAVALKRGRPITKWAQQYGLKGFIMNDGTRGLMVKGHPFIVNGFIKMLNRADIVAEKIAKKTVEG